MPCWPVEGHFEHNYSQRPSVKMKLDPYVFKLFEIVCLLGMGDLA